tara:strand:- start:5898 stop:7679 length:1782 start_codon:yes stop_codon:yes gene_type:complete
MALISKASLLMVPSTYEEGTLYNVLPSGNRAPDSTDQNSGYDQTRADFTFDRGSNAAATRIGSDGLIKKYRENLFLQSNQFDTTWVLNGTLLTSGQSGYDGSNNAWLLSKDAVQYRQIQQAISFSGVSTISFYAKEGTSSKAGVLCGSSPSNLYIAFDLTNGNVIGIQNGVVSSSSQSVGNGWYRLSVTFNGSITSVAIYPDEILGTTAGNIYIQSAQVESGLVSTDYLDSGATTAKAGVLIDLPRINYDANGENGSLLLEPSRVNKIQYANYFNGWAKTSASVTTNAAVSPDGLKNASKLVEASGSSFHFISSTPTIASGAATFSFYAKSAERTSVSAFFTQSGNNGANFDLSAETATAQGTGNTATIESVGNGWYRCVVTNSGSAQVASQVRIGIQNGALDSYVGDGTSGVYIYGAQAEAGSYPTSIIPNHGTSGGVTRAADSCSVTGVSDVIGQTEGTLFMEFDINDISAQTNDPVLIYLRGTGTESYLQINESGRLDGVYYASGATQCRLHKYSTSDGVHKVAFAYKANDFVMYVDGILADTDTSGSIGTLDEIGLQYYNSNFYGKQSVKQAALFKERLSNAELAALTA